MESIVNIGITLAMIMVGLAIVLAVVLPLIKSLGEPKVLIKSGIGVGVLLVIFLIGYALSGDEVTSTYASFGIDETGSKLVGGMLTTMYILFIASVIGIVYSEFNKALK
jgi:hypothetical protein